MDLYWEQVVENILGGATTTKTAATNLKEVKKSEVTPIESKPTSAMKKSRLSNLEKDDKVDEKPNSRRGERSLAMMKMMQPKP